MSEDQYIEVAEEILNYLSINFESIPGHAGNYVLFWTWNGLVEIGRSAEDMVMKINFHTDHLELDCNLDDASIQAIQEYDQTIIKWIEEEKVFKVERNDVSHECDR